MAEKKIKEAPIAFPWEEPGEQEKKQAYTDGTRDIPYNRPVREAAEEARSRSTADPENMNRTIRDTIEAMKAKKKAGLK